MPGVVATWQNMAAGSFGSEMRKPLPGQGSNIDCQDMSVIDVRSQYTPEDSNL